MAKCPTEGCDEVLAVHSRRKFCLNCRAMMARWAARRPAEVLDYTVRLTRSQFRIAHLSERLQDQNEAVSQFRKGRKGRGK